MKTTMWALVAAMACGVALAEERKELFPDDPFPITKEQYADLQPNSPEEAAVAAWMYRHCDDEPLKSSGTCGRVEAEGLLVGALVSGRIHKPKVGGKKGHKIVAFEAALSQVKGEHKPNPLYAKLRCGATIYSISPLGPEPALGTTSIMEGESVSGWVAFEVPAGEDVASCTWAYDVPIKGRTKWLKVFME